MSTTRILVYDDELSSFAQNFQNRGNPVEQDYLRHCRVRAFFNSNGDMVAGYALNLSRPLRYEAWIPDKKRKDIPLLISNKRLGELTCIWIKGRQGHLSSERIYLRAVLDALFSGASFMLGGTLSRVVFGIQTQILPTVLYSGVTDYFGKQQLCWIYGASRVELIKRLFTRFPMALIRKLFGKPSYLAEARAKAKALSQQPAAPSSLRHTDVQEPSHTQP